MSRRALIDRYRADDSGATAIEYGLVAAIMSVAVIGIAATGGALDAIYERLTAIVAALAG